MKIYDNNGKTFDRYTMIDDEGNMFGFSSNPLSPQGYNQFCGTLDDPHSNTEHLGKEVNPKDLPEDVRKAIEGRLE